MEIVKKNIISIICGVVAIACIGVWYFWLTGQQAELQTKLGESKTTHDALAGLLSKQRQLPTVDPDNPTVENLKQFPSQNVIDQGESITKQVEKESLAMRYAAVAMNKHTLLEPMSLPAPNSTAAYNFRRAYQLYFPPPNQGPLASQLAKDLN